MTDLLATAGWTLFEATDDTRNWAEAARQTALGVTRDPEAQARHLRYQGTWFVGVDALPNDPTGRVGGVPLRGPWEDFLGPMPDLHPAQLSVIYPGYPKRDPGQSVQNHAYRVKRRAAHVDGLLHIGPDKRRHAREFHAFILGIHLNACDGAPTVVWSGSHRIMGAAFQRAIGDRDPTEVDVTEAYQAARREVFEICRMVQLHGEPGEAFLLHRHTLHGTDVWHDGWAGEARDEGRMTAFFRPEFQNPKDWLAT